MMPINLKWVSFVMDAHIGKGNPAAELHVNQVTRDAFVETLKAAGQRPPSVRWRGEVRMEQPWTFRDVPIVLNNRIPVNGLMVRTKAQMNDPDWLEKALAQANRQALEAAGFASQSPQEPPAPAQGEIYSSEAFTTSGETVSDVLIACMTGCDDMEAVIVISAKRGEVEVRSNLERFAVIGLTQAALARVAQGE